MKVRISKPVLIAVIIISVGAILSITTLFLPMPTLGEKIFQSLIPVVAIFSGFSLTIIVYCAGRLDSLKREYIPRLDAVAKKYIQHYKRKESENKEISDEDKKKREQAESAVSNTIKEFEGRQEWLRGLSKWVSFSIAWSLLSCFIGLFYADPLYLGPKTSLWIILIWTCAGLSSIIISILQAWEKVSVLAEERESDYLRNLD